MKVRDIIIVFSGILGLLVFMALMFKNYIRMQVIQVIKKQVYYDSLLLEEQQELKEKDSIIIYQQGLLKQMLGGHAYQINTIKEKVKTLEGNE